MVDSIDIASPGTDAAALKAALAALGMPVLIASGTIASPVAQLDLLLPAGYADFELRLIGWQVDESGEDSLEYRFSFDGGSTFSSSNLYKTRYLESDSAIGSSVYT